MTRTLRIGVDARELLGETTGAGRYLGELMRRWVARDDADRRRFVMYAPETLRFALPSGAGEQRVLPADRRAAGTWWEQTTLRRAVKADRPDVFFAPAYSAPLGTGVPLAVTIHDISFIAHPEWFRLRERLRRRWVTGRVAASASVVFTDSAFSRSELETRMRVPPERIRVIPPGVAPIASDRELRSDTREPLVLFVGSLFNRRRLPDLIAAFARGTNDLPEARLAIVGADRTWPPLDLGAVAARHGVASKVELRSYVSDGELADLYRRASVLGFLSEYEGFGLTPLEALAAGVPVVVLDTPVAREVYGEAAEYVRCGDIGGTAAALRRFLTSRSSAGEQLARAPAVLARYSWDRAAEETLEHLHRVAAP